MRFAVLRALRIRGGFCQCTLHITLYNLIGGHDFCIIFFFLPSAPHTNAEYDFRFYELRLIDTRCGLLKLFLYCIAEAEDVGK